MVQQGSNGGAGRGWAESLFAELSRLGATQMFLANAFVDVAPGEGRKASLCFSGNPAAVCCGIVIGMQLRAHGSPNALVAHHWPSCIAFVDVVSGNMSRKASLCLSGNAAGVYASGIHLMGEIWSGLELRLRSRWLSLRITGRTKACLQHTLTHNTPEHTRGCACMHRSAFPRTRSATSRRPASPWR